MSHLRPISGGKGRWLVTFICCGFDDGSWRCQTWEEADALRNSYINAQYTSARPSSASRVPRTAPMARSYLRVEGTAWPNPDDPNSVEWALRYGQPTKSDLLVAASFIHAYRALIDMTQRDRNHRIATLRSARSVEDGEAK